MAPNSNVRVHAMRDRLCLIVLISALSTSVGCVSAPPTNTLRYPATIHGFGECSRFPLEAANYKRGDVVTYQPGDANISIAYEHYDIGLQNAVTLYFYPLSASFSDQVTLEKEDILRAHAGGTLVIEQNISLEKNGVSYPTYMATFRYSAVFARQEQTVISQFLLVTLPTQFFKVRSTAPIAQGRAAEESMSWVE